MSIRFLIGQRRQSFRRVKWPLTASCAILLGAVLLSDPAPIRAQEAADAPAAEKAIVEAGEGAYPDAPAAADAAAAAAAASAAAESATPANGSGSVEVLSSAPAAPAAPAAASQAGGNQAFLPESGDAFAKASDTETTTERETRLMTERLAGKRVTLNFKNEDLANIIRSLARSGELNIVIPPGVVKGAVTVYLEDVPILTALDSLLKSNELAYIVEDAGILRVTPLSKVQKAGRTEMNTIHVPLNWIKAEQMQAVLKDIVEETGGKISAEPNSNAIIVSAPPPSIERIREVIRKVDIPDKQVEIETRFCEMSDDATRELGLAWDMWRRDADFASPDRRDLFTNVFDPVTGQFTQVTEKGVPIDSLGFRSLASTFGSGGGVWNWGEVINIAGQDFRLGVKLQALEDRGDLKTLANPRLTTLNNVSAMVNLVREQPYGVVTLSPGGQSTVTPAYKDVGVNLTVVPTITDNGYVRLNLTTKQTILVRDNVPIGEGATAVMVDTRQSDTNVIVKDEGIAALFGLRKVDQLNTQTGIPWLHRAPVVGWLFKVKGSQQRRTDLALFLTPHIIKDPNLNDEQLKMYNEIDMRWHLPDYFFDDVAGPSDKGK